uniref:collagen alpha-1(VIII) chain-like n=1 Tax=Myxine glutinosa TaxID=7769 RepID=UPI00359000D6
MQIEQHLCMIKEFTLPVVLLQTLHSSFTPGNSWFSASSTRAMNPSGEYVNGAVKEENGVSMQTKTDPCRQDLPPYTPNYAGNIPIAPGHGLYPPGGQGLYPLGGQGLYPPGGQGLYPPGGQGLYPPGGQGLYPPGGQGLYPPGGQGLYPLGGQGLYPPGGQGLYPPGGQGLYPPGGQGLYPPGGQGLYQGGPIMYPQGGHVIYLQGAQVPSPRGDEYPAGVNVVYTQQPVAIPLAVEPAAGQQQYEGRKWSHYLVWSILNTIFCNFVIGAVAIMFSVKVMKHPQGPSSATYSKRALVLNVVSLLTGVIIWAVSIGILVDVMNHYYVSTNETIFVATLPILFD